VASVELTGGEAGPVRIKVPQVGGSVVPSRHIGESWKGLMIAGRAKLPHAPTWLRRGRWCSGGACRRRD